MYYHYDNDILHILIPNLDNLFYRYDIHLSLVCQDVLILL